LPPKDSMDHPNLRTRNLAAGLTALFVACALASCSTMSSRALIGTPADPSSSTSTTSVPAFVSLLHPANGFQIPDTRSVVLQKVPGKQSGPQLGVRGGQATISGGVTGPDGAVAGASVLIERFVGTLSTSVTVTTDDAGHFSIDSVLGGRYRVRAWLQPSLATLEPPTAFVADGGHLNFDISVERYDAMRLQVMAGAATMRIGDPAPVDALLVQESVDSQGIIRSVGVSGVAITLSSKSAVMIGTPNPSTTGPGGRSQWQVTCQGTGTVSVTASAAASGSGSAGSSSITATAELPPCSDRSSSSTTSTTSDVATTTTTKP